MINYKDRVASQKLWTTVVVVVPPPDSNEVNCVEGETSEVRHQKKRDTRSVFRENERGTALK